MIGALTNAAYLLVAAGTAPWWARKARGGWAERFGRVEPVPRSSGGTPRPRIMLHTVSVGETNAVRALVPMLLPHAEVVVTATTDTGLARARSLYGAAAHVRRYPLDATFSVRRFLDAIQPDVVALAELEVWPNFVRACTRRGTPVAVINGRISDRSFRGYQRLLPLLRGVFGQLAWVAAQEPGYAERFEALGVIPDRVEVTGSLKWDSAPDPPPGGGVRGGQRAGPGDGDRP